MTGLKLEFSTNAVHARDRFSLWHDVACRSYAQHECTAQTANRFEGSIAIAPLAQSALSIYDNSPMHLWRTPRQVEQAPSDRVFVCLQLENVCGIAQLGRETTLAPGDFCIVDTKWPYSFTYPEKSRQLVLNVPIAELECRLGSINTVTALAITADSGLGGLASRFMQMLSEHASALSGIAEARVATQTLDLVAMALSQRAELGPLRLGSASELALMRLRCEVEQVLSDPAIKCQDVAAKARISVRYANALLAKEGTSLERLIRTRRLEMCKKELTESSHRSISDIAYAWGFSDVSHFSRAFKNAYGLSPRDYRREKLR